MQPRKNQEWVSGICHCWPTFVLSGMIEHVLCDPCLESRLPSPRWPLRAGASPQQLQSPSERLLLTLPSRDGDGAAAEELPMQICALWSYVSGQEKPQTSAHPIIRT